MYVLLMIHIEQANQTDSSCKTKLIDCESFFIYVFLKMRSLGEIRRFHLEIFVLEIELKIRENPFLAFGFFTTRMFIGIFSHDIL